MATSGSTAPHSSSSTDQTKTTTPLLPLATAQKYTNQKDSVVTVDEVQRLIDLGLGRGVDATNPLPWKNKSSFQVRQISPTLANVIGTEEGGAHQYYENEISSVSGQQANVKLSVDEPHGKVKIGMDGEASRSVSKSRKAVGEKVVTRTISFRADFDDLPLYFVDDDTSARTSTTHTPFPTVTSPTLQPQSPQPSEESVSSTFEVRLCEWILDRIYARQDQAEELQKSSKKLKPSTGVAEVPRKDKPVADLSGDNPVTKLNDYLRSVAKGSPELQEIARDCYEFVTLLGITHYVYAVELGAVKYRVYTIAEYHKKFGGGGHLAVEGIVDINASGGYGKKTVQKSTRVREIGKIEKGSVERGTRDEAVIAIEIKPIHKLVQLRYIHLAMQQALKDYISERADKSEGPFLIACGNNDSRIYWKVNKQNRVIGTKDVKQSSIFYVSPIDDPEHPHEFLIGYYGEQTDTHKQPKGVADPLSKKTQVAPVARYLDARVSLLGYNEGPLELRHDVYEENSRLILQSRIIEKYTPVSTQSWIEGEEFFVNCTRRKFRVDGYIAMKNVGRNADGFRTECVPSVKKHNGSDTWMLFRLLPSEYREHAELAGPTVSERDLTPAEQYPSYSEDEFEHIFGPDYSHQWPPLYPKTKDSSSNGATDAEVHEPSESTHENDANKPV